jgi:hypothetical protein
MGIAGEKENKEKESPCPKYSGTSRMKFNCFVDLSS